MRNHLPDLLRKSANLFKDKKCVVDVGKGLSLSFDQVNRHANKLAQAMIALGVQKGDCINVLFHNDYHYVELYLAMAKTGKVRAALNSRESAPEHIFKINSSQGKALFFDAEYLDLVKGIRDKLETIKYFVCTACEQGQLPEGILSYDTLIADAPDFEPEVEVHDEDFFRLAFSGGTTGVAKAAIHTYKTELAFYGNLLLDALPVKKHDVFMHVHPLSHGTACFVMPSFMRGASQVVLDKTDAVSILNTIQKERITMGFLIPTLLRRLLACPDVRNYDFSSLRWVIYGAAPIAQSTLEEAIMTFGNVFCQIWGQVEVPVCATYLPPEEHVIEGSEADVKRLLSCGKETTKCVVKVVDENDKELPPGEVGELVVRSDHMTVGYLDSPEETAVLLKDGWLHTKDMGYRDQLGYFYLAERKSEMIISGGFNVYPTEVENVLSSHPCVLEAAVIGVSDPSWGETVKALVVLKKGQDASEKELIEFTRERLASYKCPRFIEFLTEPLPKTSVGKMARKELKKKYWEPGKRSIS